MIKIATLVFSVLFTAPFGICEDLVLRIDTVGFEDVEKDFENQEAKLLRKIEAFVEPGEKFRAKCRMGLQEVGVSGYVEAVRDGGFKISLDYHYEMTTPEPAGMPLRSGFQSSVRLIPGKPVAMSGTNKIERSAAGRLIGYTKTEIVVALVEVKSDE